MPDRSTRVRCSTCHRLEDWVAGHAPVVVSEGGARRPEGHALRATWEALEASLAAGGPVVAGPCAMCGQPMMAAAGSAVPSAPWRMTLPPGELVVSEDGIVTGPEGTRLSVADARALVLAHTGPGSWLQRVQPARSAFQAFLIASILGPVSAFLLAVLALSIFMRSAADEWAKLGARLLEILR